MHGFGHIEIPTTDFKKAKRFFGTVFGWEFQDVPDMEYVLFKTGQLPNGGFVKVKKMRKSGQVNVYIEVEDIDSKLKEIKKGKRESAGEKGARGERRILGPVHDTRWLQALSLGDVASRRCSHGVNPSDLTTTHGRFRIHPGRSLCALHSRSHRGDLPGERLPAL